MISKKDHLIIEEVVFNIKEKIQLLKEVIPIYNKTFDQIKNFVILDERQNIKIDVLSLIHI